MRFVVFFFFHCLWCHGDILNFFEYFSFRNRTSTNGWKGSMKWKSLTWSWNCSRSSKFATKISISPVRPHRRTIATIPESNCSSIWMTWNVCYPTTWKPFWATHDDVGAVVNYDEWRVTVGRKINWIFYFSFCKNVSCFNLLVEVSNLIVFFFFLFL